jgi:hypothetical protein
MRDRSSLGVVPEARFMAQLPPTTRLSAPAFRDRHAEVYAQALEALAERRVPCLLGGAVAFNHFTGIWRDTKDIDVFCRPEDAQRVLDALADAGFRTEVVYESWLGKAFMGEVFVDVIWRNANGLFPVTDEWFEHAPEADLFGSRQRMVPLEELILSKIFVAGRYRFDGADILHILHATGDLVDWERLARVSGEHAGLVLAYLHMYRWGYPGWRERVPQSAMDLLEKQALEAGSSYGPFRALLLDIQSFQVDVDDWGLPDPHRKALEDIFGDAEGRQ